MANSYYFQHDFSAFTDTKILFLRQQLGMEGYGIFWVILEQLGLSGGKLPLKIIPVLAMQMQTQEVKVRAVIHEFYLFEVDGDGFFNHRLNEHIGRMKKITEGGKLGADRRWKNGGGIRGANGGGIGDGNGGPNAYIYIDRDIDIDKKGNAPTLIEVKDYFKLKGFPEALAEKAFEYYEVNNWKDGKGKKVINWKQKMLAVWMKDDNKTPCKKMVI